MGSVDTERSIETTKDTCSLCWLFNMSRISVKTKQLENLLPNSIKRLEKLFSTPSLIYFYVLFPVIEIFIIWIKIDQLMSLALFFAQHVSNASTFIFRSLRLCVGILLWFDVCWCYGVVRLGWSYILMQAEALKMNVLVFETCWAKNKASDISWSIFIQLWRWCTVQ